MSAREMFESLGFKRIDSDYLIEYVIEDNFYKKQIKFWLDDKMFYNNLIYDNEVQKGSCSVKINLFKAIQKQIEELGWN